MSIKAIAKQQFNQIYQQQFSEYVTGLTWSPDGDLLAMVTAAGELAVWQAEEITLLKSKSNYSLNCLGFSADGQWLAVAGQRGEVEVWRLDSDTRRLVTTIHHEKAWIDSLVWHPQQNLLAYGVNRLVTIWDADKQEVITSLDFKNSSVFNLAWHPQGNLLAASGHGGVKVWQSNNSTQKPYLLQVPGASLDCAWSADGKYLASGNLDRTISLLRWDNPPPWLMQGFPGKVSQVTWSFANQSLLAASCQEGVTIWQYKAQKWHSQILKHQTTVRAIAFSVNSSLLATTGDDGNVSIWQGKKLLQSFKALNSGFSCLVWHPTGKYLAAGGQNGELIVWQESNSGKGFS